LGMDRIWQWAWDRHGPRYSWAIWGIMFVPMLLSYLLLSSVLVAFEGSSHYVEAAVFTVAAVLVDAYVVILPGSRLLRLAQRWAAGHEVDRAKALQETYTWTRAAGVRALWFQPV
jgi:adenylate cyclase